MHVHNSVLPKGKVERSPSSPLTTSPLSLSQKLTAPFRRYLLSLQHVKADYKADYCRLLKRHGVKVGLAEME